MERIREKIHISISLSGDVVNELRKVSKNTGIRMNFMVEKAVKEYLDRYLDNHNLLGHDLPPQSIRNAIGGG